MANKVDSIFLVIEAKGNEFLEIGFGGGGEVTTSQHTDGVLAGFAEISIGGGGCLVCDDCNDGILPSDTCYYVAVLNRVFCKKCYDEWIASAKYYPDDAPYEERNYKRTMLELKRAELWQDK